MAKAEYYNGWNEDLADFEAEVKKFLHRGRLNITEKKLSQVPGGPPPGSSPQLRHEHGDMVTSTSSVTRVSSTPSSG
ncbi:hypothetical protein [Streptomyces noursei]|uniref:hypothetical protein n=1 Tax=Streptomyces noursei TaxID=1971 RepID=UPI0023B7ACD7|nr:hypothetical protein [Streptomyces noursei]